LYRTAIYLAAGASAEFLADIALAPWEATKVRMQTQDNWAGTLREGLPKLYGMSSFYFLFLISVIL
jgi:solute carrier family 25 phosphate transporter 3